MNHFSVACKTAGMGILVLALFACGSDPKALEGERCMEDADCADAMSCIDSVCIGHFDRELYEDCLVDEQCNSGTCAAGFCAEDCGQFYPLYTYRIGDCVADDDPLTCQRDGVGCCKITSITENQYDQQEVRGFCTTSP